MLALTVLHASLASTQQTSGARPMNDLAYVDHIILAVDNLERGMDQLEKATGVRPVFGGAHPGRGTQNALLSLGNNQYLELLAPNPADSSSAQDVADRIKAAYARYTKPTPTGWAIHVAAADGERARLLGKGFNSSDVEPGSRMKPDGQTLRWRTFDPWGLENRLLPFAIEWGAGTAHPSTTSPAGCTLVDLFMESAAADSTRAIFARAGYPLKINAGPKDRLTLTIDCPKGRVTFE
jgi:hypothetical protein